MLVPSHHAPKVGYQRLFPAGLRSPRQEDADRMVWVFRRNNHPPQSVYSVFLNFYCDTPVT